MEPATPYLGGKARLIVRIEAPFQVLATEFGLDELLGYTAEDIHGRPVQILQGPETDELQFLSSIKYTALLRTTTLRTAVYERSGHGKIAFVTCAPFYDKRKVLTGCMITIENLNEGQMKEAFEEEFCAKALISAEQSDTIQLINDEFTNVFGFTQREIVGESLRLIQSPRTQFSRLCKLFQAACAGETAQDTIFIANRMGLEFPSLVTCLPVADPLKGRIGHILTLFRLASPPSGNRTPCFQHDLPVSKPLEAGYSAGPAGGRPHPPPFDPAHAAQAHPERGPPRRSPANAFCGDAADLHAPPPAAFPPPAPAPPAPAVQPGFLAQPSQKGFGPAIFPRRKAGSSASAQSCPVVVTATLVGSLAHLPLSAAAQRVGVSATALKKACRKLGVPRWPYKKNGANLGDAAGDGAPRPLDEGYVRKLFRKYSAAAKPAGVAVGAAAGVGPAGRGAGVYGGERAPAPARAPPPPLDDGDGPGDAPWAAACPGFDDAAGGEPFECGAAGAAGACDLELWQKPGRSWPAAMAVAAAAAAAATHAAAGLGLGCGAAAEDCGASARHAAAAAAAAEPYGLDMLPYE